MLWRTFLCQIKILSGNFHNTQFTNFFAATLNERNKTMFWLQKLSVPEAIQDYLVATMSTV